MKPNNHLAASLRLLIQPQFKILGICVLLLAFLQRAPAANSGKTFDSPEAAVQALTSAVNSRDTSALAAIFGRAFEDIRSEDVVQNQNELATFATRLNASHHIAKVDDNRRVLEVGDDAWPFAIPLVRKDGSWFFDTDAGKEELINRRIGESELQALKSLRAGAQAQREYASVDRDGDQVLEYAQKIFSTPGTKDGLYWPVNLDGDLSPLGPAFARAQSEGYFKGSRNENLSQPFHGYFYKVLTRQGKNAPGGEYDYIINGNMIGGFAFVAWPAEYDETGIMTFIINQQGKVYQRDLGADTEATVAKMNAYDPGPGWAVSPD